jgi:hypothetical protein
VFDVCRHRCWPMGEWVVVVADRAEFGVFDDVWPVFEDPLPSETSGSTSSTAPPTLGNRSGRGSVPTRIPGIARAR